MVLQSYPLPPSHLQILPGTEGLEVIAHVFGQFEGTGIRDRETSASWLEMVTSGRFFDELHAKLHRMSQS
jgi:hypothetical protein